MVTKNGNAYNAIDFYSKPIESITISHEELKEWFMFFNKNLNFSEDLQIVYCPYIPLHVSSFEEEEKEEIW